MQTIRAPFVAASLVLLGSCAHGCGGSSGGAAAGNAAAPASSTTPAASPAPTVPPAVGVAPTPVTPAPVGSPAFTQLAVALPQGPLMQVPPGYVQSGGDPVRPPMLYEADRFTDRNPALVPSPLRVVAWNVRLGSESDRVLQALRTHPRLAGADVILLTEVGRGCLDSRPQLMNQARELAIALRMDYALVAEWDHREVPTKLGENCSAILSKYPIGGPLAVIRHGPLHDYWRQSRYYGGRVTLGADLLIGNRLLRVYTSHLCVRDFTGQGRARQAAEALADADLPGRTGAQLYAGDLNTWAANPLLGDVTRPPFAEPVIQDFLAAGWTNGTGSGFSHLGNGFFPQRLDWLFHRGVIAGAGAIEEVGGSGHRPLWMTFDLP